MKYYFAYRGVPKPGYKYPPKFLPEEHLNLDQIKEVKLVDKPISYEHMIDVGKDLYQVVLKDGTHFNVGYFDSDTPQIPWLGKLLLNEVEKGIIKHVSPGYNFNVEGLVDSKTGKTAKITKINKDWLHTALTDKPDFGEEGGCEILFGATEKDLNLKMKGLISKLSDVASSSPLSSALSPSNMSAPVENTLKRPADAPAEAPAAKDAKTDAEPNPEEIQKIILKNPAVVDKIDTEDLKGLVLTLVHDQAARANTTPAAPGPNAAATNPPATPAPANSTPATPAPQNNSIHVPFVPPATPNNEQFEKVSKMAQTLLKDRFDSLNSAFEGMVQHMPQTGPKFDVEKTKNTINAWGQAMLADPLSPHLEPALKAANVMSEIMVHTAATWSGMNQNQQTRETFMQHKTDADTYALKQALGNYDRYRNNTQSVPQTPPQQPTLPESKDDAKYDELVLTKIRARMSSTPAHMLKASIPNFSEKYIPAQQQGNSTPNQF